MFNLGNIVITLGIKEAINENLLTNEDLYKFLGLHIQNISECSENDKKYNLEDIKNKEGRVLNKYTICNKKIFIDTHLGQVNQTTIMFANEY
ncbi:hypothetical protein ACFO6R_15850 [Eubacterium multiforme]|nr:hypothetical protein [Eubacterium multiforme]